MLMINDARKMRIVTGSGLDLEYRIIASICMHFETLGIFESNDREKILI